MVEACVDANLIVKWYLFEGWRDESIALLDECDQLGIAVIVPDVALAEAGSAIRRAVHRSLISEETGRLAISLLLRAPVERYDVRDLLQPAWHIAAQHRLATLYDAYYVALAEMRGCVFWTADERLINSLGNLAHVRHIRDFSPGMLES